MRIDPDTGEAEFCRNCKYWTESPDFNELKLNLSGYCLRYAKQNFHHYKRVADADATHWCSEFKSL